MLGMGLPLFPDKLCIAVCGRAGASKFLEVLILRTCCAPSMQNTAVKCTDVSGVLTCADMLLASKQAAARSSPRAHPTIANQNAGKT